MSDNVSEYYDSADDDSVLGDETDYRSASVSLKRKLPPAFDGATSLPLIINRDPMPWSGKLKTWADAEAILNKKGWKPPHPDNTVPKLGTKAGDKAFTSYAAQVSQALQNVDGILDNPVHEGRRGNRILKGGFKEEEYEARAMQVVKLAIDLHLEGSSLNEQIDQAGATDKGLKFKERMAEVCNTLSKWKSASIEVMDGHKALIVVNAPKASFTRKANNRRNNEEKSKKLAQIKGTPAKPKTPAKAAGKQKKKELTSGEKRVLGVKVELEEDEYEMEVEVVKQ
ncbi:hypothetical protein NA57DRAFT_70158 [Rhizodiscina lignyota]|uniref:Uncharacterized protein n=1 Tax=Rhizodiscina lignyota TaxID=1504668 RepID=A0A9P4MAR2_9PEZI|nr:hypothetical protein NA57DRAFT_70158 [Rhizodiscina lignyota]